MTNHPNRSRKPYTARIGGHSWSRGPEAEFGTIRECRAFAESYGSTADYCTIEDHKGRAVASHRRDTSGDGMRWFRAEVYDDPR
jgi:hypothetical protein